MNYRLMGINSDSDVCSCCGKKGLKRVAWLAPLDVDGNVCGEVAAFGCVCASLALGHGKLSPSKAEKQITSEIKESEHFVDCVMAYFHRGQLSRCAYPGKTFVHYYSTTAEIAKRYEAGEITIEEVFKLTEARSAGVFVGDRHSHYDRLQNIKRWETEKWFPDFQEWLSH